MRFALRFGFNTLPETVKIDSAFIYLSAYNPGHFGKENSFIIKPISEIWINDEINWDNQPKSDSTRKIVVGAPANALENYRINVTEFIIEIVENRSPNFGFLFGLEDEKKSYKGLKFHSSESQDEMKRPKLEIFFKEN